MRSASIRTPNPARCLSCRVEAGIESSCQSGGFLIWSLVICPLSVILRPLSVAIDQGLRTKDPGSMLFEQEPRLAHSQRITILQPVRLLGHQEGVINDRAINTAQILNEELLTLAPDARMATRDL